MTIQAHMCPDNPDRCKHGIIYYDIIDEWRCEDDKGNTERINYCPFCGIYLPKK